MPWQKLAMLADVHDNAPLETGTQELPLALFKVGDNVYCTSNLCTHAEAFLTDGYLEGYEIECPLHGARFDIRDGRVLCHPAAKDVATYPVRVENGEVFVELP